MKSLASVHGRFQPPHLDHLEYILASAEKADHLIIGITQPDYIQLVDCPEDPHRADRIANPLSFDERCAAIRVMLIASGIPVAKFSFVRFPIEVPEKLRQTLSTDVICYTTIRDQWNRVKVERLKDLGYEVKILWDRSDQAGRNGTAIRAKIYAKDDAWREDVAPSVAEYLISSGIINRMQSVA